MKKIDNEEKYLKELLKEPILLWRIVLDGLDYKIAGESTARKVIFLCAMGAFVKNASKTSYNLMVNSESGAGKDHVVRNVLSVFNDLNEDKINSVAFHRTRISATTLTYWHNSLFEPKWNWNGKILYLEDVSNNILNCEVFKVFTSSGSVATIVKDQRAIDIKIKGKPVVIITSASADPEPELLRRFLVINLTETREQTKEVMELIERNAKKEVEKEENDYHNALKILKSQKVSIPFAGYIQQFFPKDHIITRTNYSRFFDFIKASAVLHQYARKFKDGHVVAEGQDYDYAREVLLATSSTVDLVPLTISQREIIDILEELGTKIGQTELGEKETGWSVQELLLKVPLSMAQLYRELSKLTKLKYIKKELFKGEYDKKPHAVYTLLKQQKFNLPTWEEINKNIPRPKLDKGYEYLKECVELDNHPI